MSRHIAAVIAGGGGSPFNFNDRTIDWSQPYAGTAPTAVAGIEINRNGTITVITGILTTSETNTVITDEWTRPAAIGATFGDGFEIRTTVSTGSSPGATSDVINSWLAISSDRRWVFSTTSQIAITGDWLIEIRPIGGNVVASATMDMSVSTNNIGT